MCDHEDKGHTLRKEGGGHGGGLSLPELGTNPWPVLKLTLGPCERRPTLGLPSTASPSAERG